MADPFTAGMAASLADSALGVVAKEAQVAIGKVIDNVPAIQGWVFGKTDLSSDEYDSGALLTDAKAQEAAEELIGDNGRVVKDSLKVTLKPKDTDTKTFWLGRRTGIKSAADIAGADVTGYWLKVPLDIVVTVGEVTMRWREYKTAEAARKALEHAADSSKPDATDDDIEPKDHTIEYIHQIQVHKGSGKFYVWAMRSGKLVLNASTQYKDGKPKYRLQLNLTNLVGWMRKDPDESTDYIDIDTDGTPTAVVTNRLGPKDGL